MPADAAKICCNLEIRGAGAKGRGVFAVEPIKRDTPLLAMGGQVLTSTQLTDDMLAMQIGDDLWLASEGTLLDDLVNHSCTPNAGFVEGNPVLVALRDIAAGEEICWDYSTSLAE